MVGSLGTEKMTAVSIAGQLFLYSFLLYLADCQVPGIYSAQYFGQGNKEGYQKIFRLKVGSQHC